MKNLFEYYIDAGFCRMKYAKGKPSALGREFHDYDEIVLFLDGDVQFISKNIRLKLSSGSIAVIPKENFHQFYMTEYDSYTRCVIDFRETEELRPLIREVMTEVSVIAHPSKTVRFLYERLMNLIVSDISDSEKCLALRSAISIILLEQKMFSGKSIKRLIDSSEITQKALEYIDKNYADELTLADIADKLNVSVSSLSHKFSKDLNISVYRYMTEKRLSVARQHIEKGATLAEASEKSGFKDYSAFFRIFKNYYGEAPSVLLKSK